MTRKDRMAAPLMGLYLFIVAMLMVACPQPCPAADVLSPIGSTIPLVSDYNLASTSYIYCYTQGRSGGVRGDWVQEDAKIKTTGSSTTTASNTASTAAFNNVSVGDEILVYVSGLPTRRYVTAVASVNSVTVNSAWDLSAGYVFYVRHLTCSTAATAGWFRVADTQAFSLEVKITTFNATAIDTQVQCRADDATGETNTAYTQHYTSTAADVYVFAPQLGPLGDECRVGMKITASGGTNAVTLNLLTR